MDKKLLILLSIVFIDLLGFGIVIPILPIFIERLGGNPLLVGIVIGAYSFSQFLFSPVLGRLSDKYGRKPVLLISTMINALGYTVIFFSHTFAQLILGRVLGGIGTANISVVQAYIADTSSAHERTKRLALIGAIFGLGFIFGPFIGGITASKFDLNMPFLLTALTSLINAFLITLFLPESNRSLQKHIKIELINTKVIREVLTPKNMAFLIFLFFLINLSLSLTIGVFPLYSQERFGWNEERNGYYFMIIGIVSFIMQAFGIRMFLRYFREARLVKAGLVIFSIGTCSIGVATGGLLLLVSGAISSSGFALVNASVQAMISLESSSEEQGVVLGVAQSFAALARVLGPLIGGAAAMIDLRFPYFLSGIMVSVVFLWGHRKLRLIRQNVH